MFSCFRRIAIVLYLLSGVASANEINAGFFTVDIDDPVSEKPMSAAIFFPTEDHAGITKIGPIEILAAKDASVQSGRHPLVLLSHGSGGSMFSHHDTAVFLAKHGFIVAAIEHPGDNFRDESGLGTDRVLIGRSMQLSRLLDFLLYQASFSTSIDIEKIGVAGFSAGGYTALVMVGATPKFSRLKAYCALYPKSILCSGGGVVSLSSPPLVPKADERIRAAFVMSPVAAFFDREGLSKIPVPIELYAAGGDSVLPIHDNARWVRDNVTTLAKYTELSDADHFVFLSPCTPQMESIMPRLCVDAPGIDRRAVHESVNGDMLRFFSFN